jgi:O-antigen ligase
MEPTPAADRLPDSVSSEEAITSSSRRKRPSSGGSSLFAKGEGVALLPLLFLLALVALVPMPFGSNAPWAFRLMVLATGGILILFAASRMVPSTVTLAVAGYRQWLLAVAVPFALAVGWMAAQWLPVWPESAVHPLWLMAKETLANYPSAPSVELNRRTLSPDRTLDGLMLMLAYGLIFLLAAWYGRSYRHSSLFLKLMAYSGIAYAVYGLMVEVAGGTAILWLPKMAYEGSLTSTFVNRNSYATFAGFGLLACLALLVKGTMQHTEGLRGRSLTKQMVHNLTSREILPPVAGFLILAIALIATDSRAGVMAVLLGATVLMIAAASTREYRRLKRAGKWFSLLLVVVLGGLLTMAGNQLSGRLSTLVSGDGDSLRGEIYRNSLAALQSEALGGTGAGTFEEVFRQYRGMNDFGGDAFWWQLSRIDHAHNTYLELALTVGIPATLLLVAAVLACLARMAIGLKERRRGGLFPAYGLAVGVMVGVHGFFDFSLEIPAIAASFAAVLGFGFAQSFSTRKEQEKEQGALRSGGVVTEKPAKTRQPAMAVLALVAGALLLKLSFPPFLVAWGEREGAEILRKTAVMPKPPNYEIPSLTLLEAETLATLQQEAIARWPDERHYRTLGLAQFLIAKEKKEAGEEYQPAVDAMESALLQAVTRAPAEPYSWLRLALARIEAGDGENAARALAMSIATAPYDPVLIVYRLQLAAGLQSFVPEGQRYLYEGQACAALKVKHHHLIQQLETFTQNPKLNLWLCERFAACGNPEPTRLEKDFCLKPLPGELMKTE